MESIEYFRCVMGELTIFCIYLCVCECVCVCVFVCVCVCVFIMEKGRKNAKIEKSVCEKKKTHAKFSNLCNYYRARFLMSFGKFTSELTPLQSR